MNQVSAEEFLLTVWPSIQNWPYKQKEDFEKNYQDTFSVGIYQALAECLYANIVIMYHTVWIALHNTPKIAHEGQDTLIHLTKELCDEFYCIPPLKGEWLNDHGNMYLTGDERTADAGSSFKNFSARVDLYEESLHRGVDKTLSYKFAAMLSSLCGTMDFAFTASMDAYFRESMSGTSALLEQYVDKCHLHFRCPDCQNQIQTPINKGSIQVKCPSCSCQFRRET